MAMRRRWATEVEEGALTPAGNNAVVRDMFSDAEAELGARITPCTITRMIGRISWFGAAESTPVPGTAVNAWAGLIVVSRNVVGATAGDAQIPDPRGSTEEHPWLWVWHERMVIEADHPASQQYPYYPNPKKHTQ